MFTSTSNADLAEAGAAEVLIPLIRAAATISFAIVPCSLGFVIIAVSEQLIRSIMVGDDPEILVSDLQNQFPNNSIEVIENDNGALIAKVVDLIERRDPTLDLQKVPAGATASYTFLAEQIGAPSAVREAAQACAVNHLAAGSPCHQGMA